MFLRLGMAMGDHEPDDPRVNLVLLVQHLGEPVSPEMLGWPTARGVLYVPADDVLPKRGMPPGR